MLQQGKLVAMPTETVYGLGADASNPSAVAKIFKAKGRPADHPLIVHLAYATQMKDWAENVPDAAMQLASAFWPGPLTLILAKKSWVPVCVSGGQNTIGLRVPDHPVALWLLRVFGGGIAAPSANRFGRISPTLASHVAEELGDSVDCILDGGPCQVGVESTILDLSTGQPVLLRPGRISVSELEQVLQTKVQLKPQHAVRAPGMLAVHYAPHTLAYLCANDQLAMQVESQLQQGKKPGLLIFQETILDLPQTVPIIHLPFKPSGYEQAVYSALRTLDKQQCDLILIEQPPNSEAWHPVNDRLSKATVQC